MVAVTYTVAFHGVEARPVEVQCALAPGLPSFQIVGLANKAVSEVFERAHIAEAASFRLAAGRGPSQPRKSRKAAAAAQPEKMAMANESSP